MLKFKELMSILVSHLEASLMNYVTGVEYQQIWHR